MNARSVLAFRVIPIENFDELTFHFLDVINVHLSIVNKVDGVCSATPLHP